VIRTRSLFGFLAFSLGALFVLLLASGCYPDHPQSTFDARGPVAESQRFLFYLIFWVALFVFIAVEGALLYAVIRYRRRPGQGIPVQVHGNTRLELAWTIAPVFVLAVIAVPTVTTLYDLAEPPAGEQVLNVEVIGHQWWFEFRYPDYTYAGADGRARVLTTATELHIPVGVAVDFTLKSKDVLHSFWVPKLGGKTDLVPNHTNRMWYKADEPGIYFGQCAEFCGLSHAFMRLRVVAQAQADFDKWVMDQQAPPAVATEALMVEGARIFTDEALPGGQRCAFCHTVEGSSQGTTGPNLSHLASRDTIAGGLMDRNDANLAKWLEDPTAVKPGSFMPDLDLNEQQVSALVAYLQNLK
jgi:cytochrome c oxidase subunit 2